MRPSPERERERTPGTNIKGYDDRNAHKVRTFAQKHTNLRERLKMARSGHERNSRHQDNSNQHEDEDNVRHMSERSAEQTAQMGQSATEVGEQAARLGSEMLKRNAETIQNAWRSGQEMATAVSDQLGRTLGVSGNEAQQLAERSARNAETIINSTAAVSELMNGMSREYSAFARGQAQKCMERMNDLWRCRTPQEFVAVQTDFFRDALDSALEISRRMNKLSDDTVRRVSQEGRRAA